MPTLAVDDRNERRVIVLQSLSNTQLIQILQHNEGDDDLTRLVEGERDPRATLAGIGSVQEVNNWRP